MKKKHSFFRKLKNKNGFDITFCDFGAVISSVKIPVSDTEKADVVLGFDQLEDYQESFTLSSQPFFGAVVGPHAGRVEFGRYRNGNKEVQLEQNAGMHHLHGGSINLSNQFWNLVFESEETLIYDMLINDNKTKITVEYFLDEENTLHTTLTAITEEDILINLTQHSYFNLEGHDGDVTNLKMKVFASEILEKNKYLLPTGVFLKTENTAMDFSDFKNCPAAIDTSFVLNNGECAAILKNEKNNWVMEVRTNQPSVHIYIGAQCDPLIGKENTVYHKSSGICFEAQNFPDSPNHKNFKNGILKAGETYRNEIAFAFRKTI